jgi:hypothetical protein
MRQSQRAGVAAVAGIVAATAVVVLPTGSRAIEVATDDFRVSEMGPDTTIGFEAQQAKIAYDPVNQQYLAVWRGDDQGDGQAEVYGQLIDARTSGAVGADFLIAQVGTAGDAATDAIEPAVVWSGDNEEFVVVYTGDEDASDTVSIVSDTFEIYAQRVSTGGAPVGSPLRVSDMGSDDANGSFDANFADIAWNSTANEFLVVWQGDDNTAPLVNNETEIHGQRLGYSSGNLVELGANDLRISQVGVDGATLTDGRAPAVAYNAIGNQYYVVWEGNYDAGSPAVFEVHGTTVSAAGVVASQTGTVLNTIAASDEELQPDVAADAATGNFAVVWMGDNGSDEFEIYRQLVDSGGALSGTSLAISAAGPAGNTAFVANTPAITFDTLQDEYVVVWSGDDSALGTIDDEYEVFLRRLTSSGATSGIAARISTMGVNAQVNSSTSLPDVTFSDDSIGAVGTVWNAENQPTTAAGEGEIWGQFDAPGGDLSVTITVQSDTSPAPGAVVTYQIDWANQGTTTIPDVTLTSSVGALFANADGTPDPDDAGPPMEWVLGTLDPGETGSVTVSGTVSNAAVNGQSVTFDASIATGSLVVETDPTDNSDTDSVVVDTPPTVTIDQAGGQADPTNASPISYTVVFSESVTGFDGADVSLAGSTLSGLSATVSGSGANYTVSVTGMDGVGTVVASIPAGGAQDTDGDTAEANLASTSTDNTVSFDNVPPTVTINQAGGQADPTNASPILFTVVFSESVTGFDGADVSLAGSTLSGLSASVSGSGANYTVSVTGMDGVGTVVASIPAGSATDLAGNANAASTSTDNTVSFDNVPPTVTINQAGGQADPTNASPILFTVVFSESVTGFDDADVSFTGSTVGGTLVANVSGSGASYTVSVTGMTSTGNVVASVATNAASDAAGNLSTASTSTDNTVSFDSAAPTVTIDQAGGQADPTNASPILFTVVFSESVTGFDGGDVSFAGSTVGGTLVANVSGSGASYTVSVSGMDGAGTVVASIPAGSAIDTAGNANVDSTSTDNTVTFDNVPPSVTINQAAGQDDPTNTAPIEFTVTFASPVTGFTAGDVTLGGTAGGPMVATVSGVGPVFTVSVTGMAGFGTVIATIPAGAAIDAAGNPSTASTSTDNTVTFVPGDPNPGVNDPPVLTAPVTASAELGIATLFAGGNAVSVVDPDAFASDVQVTVTITDGTAIVPNTAGVVITGGGTAQVTLTGAQSAANSALSGLGVIFTEVGSKAIAVSVSDLGHSPGPALTDTATITVTVADTIPPVIVVPPATVLATTDPGQPGAIVTYVVTVTDVGSSPASPGLVQAAPPTLTCTPASGSFFPIGTTTVNCTATDSVGNTASASFAVQVVDDEDPTITPPANVRVTLPPGASSGSVTYTVPSAADNSGTVTITCTPASGSMFATGTTTVSCTATDPSGNTATATFQVQVVSGVLPPTGGGGMELMPLATVALLAGLALLALTPRRRPT